LIDLSTPSLGITCCKCRRLIGREGDFQLPLSGSLKSRRARDIIPYSNLSTPSLGITITIKRGETEIVVTTAFNSLSRDHLTEDDAITVVETDFQLPLSGSHLEHYSPVPFGYVGSLSTPSLGITRIRARGPVIFGPVFQLPLSGSRASSRPRRRCGAILSTPSLGITGLRA